MEIPKIHLLSTFCLTPTQCFPVKTEVPPAVVLVLAGCTFLLVERLINLINN